MNTLRKVSSKLRCYTSDQIDEVWETHQPHIQRALDRGSNYCIDEVYDGLKLKMMQLWCWGNEAALVTTIQSKQDKKWLLFLALGGAEMSEWVQYLPLVEEWAREKGCSEMRIYGRSGWAKVAGFDVEYTKMVREL